MKSFDSLTEQELVALDEDAIQRYIDYACAENGVPLPSLPPAPATVDYTPDVTVYSVGHWLHFRSAEQAARVLDAIGEANPFEMDYLNVPTGVTSHALTARRSSSLVVTPIQAFSTERAAALKEALAGAKRAEDIYQKARKAYDSAVSERESYADDIRGKVADAWERHNDREARRRDYERYLSLADGDTRIAARFLANAHHDARTLLPELFDFPRDVAEAKAPEPELVSVDSGEDDIAF